MREPKTLEQIKKTISIAKDSVWVINNEIEKAEVPLSQESKGNIERNVTHLELVMADPEIINSGEDISELQTAITAGKAALA